MKYQLAKFTNPSLSVCGRFVWVRNERPVLWATKWSVDSHGNVVKGPDEGMGIETTVFGEDDEIFMPAMIADIELQGIFAEQVYQVSHKHWRALDNDGVMALRKEALENPVPERR